MTYHLVQRGWLNAAQTIPDMRKEPRITLADAMRAIQEAVRKAS